MKKILIIIPTLRSGGGVIRGLQNMLALLPENKFEIDVLAMGYSDSNNISLTNCNVLDDNFSLTAVTAIYAQTTDYKNRRKLKIVKGLLSLFGKLRKRSWIENKLFQIAAKKYAGYDKVIAYQEGHSTHFVQYIDTPCRIAWIHCDYASWKKTNERNEEKVYAKYQHVVCVSKFTLNNFQSIYPSLKNKSKYIHNLLDKDFIQKESLIKYDDNNTEENVVRLVSIGRINRVKQFNLIPKIISQMLNLGAKDFRWLLIGGGEDKSVYDEIERECKRYNITDKQFVFLGSKFNPYPYIKHSDILVSTSSSEACPFVVNEARVLGVPVVSNDYPSIYEFIKDGVNGKICTIDSMASILSDLILNRGKLDLLRKGMKENDYNNDNIINDICNLLDSDS